MILDDILNKMSRLFGFNNDEYTHDTYKYHNKSSSNKTINNTITNGNIFENPYDGRHIIMQVLHNYKFYKEMLDSIGIEYILVIYNDREYIVKCEGFDFNHPKNKYSNRLYQDGYYFWSIPNYFKIDKNILEKCIKNLMKYRITINCDNSTSNTFTGSISHCNICSTYNKVKWDELF